MVLEIFPRFRITLCYSRLLGLQWLRPQLLDPPSWPSQIKIALNLRPIG